MHKQAQKQERKFVEHVDNLWLQIQQEGKSGQYSVWQFLQAGNSNYAQAWTEIRQQSETIGMSSELMKSITSIYKKYHSRQQSAASLGRLPTLLTLGIYKVLS